MIPKIYPSPNVIFRGPTDTLNKSYEHISKGLIHRLIDEDFDNFDKQSIKSKFEVESLHEPKRGKFKLKLKSTGPKSDGCKQSHKKYKSIKNSRSIKHNKSYDSDKEYGGASEGKNLKMSIRKLFSFQTL